MFQRVEDWVAHHLTAAWLSAIVAVFSLAVALYVGLRDRVRLSVSWRQFQPMRGPQFDNKRLYVVLTVANRGRRPVTLSRVGYRFWDGSDDLVLYDEFRDGPVELTEGKSVSYPVSHEDLPLRRTPTGVHPSWVTPHNIMYAWVRLTTGQSYRGYGRRWWMSRWDILRYERMERLIARLRSRM